MKKIQLIMLAMLVALVPGIASGVSIALDFTGGGSAWTISGQSGLPAYAPTLELGGDPTKIAYEQNTTDAAHITMWQQVVIPVGATNVRLDALASGYSSWIMLGRIGLSTVGGIVVPSGTYWADQNQNVAGVVVDTPISIVDTLGIFDGTTPSYVGAELHKGLAAVYVMPALSQIVLSYDVIPEPSSIALVAFAALAFMKRR